MDLQPSQIRNIVLDLGGVLYAIEPARTERALTALAGPRARQLAMDDPLFLALERGLVSPADFRQQLREAIDSAASDAQLDTAWNALLLGPIAGRAAWVRRLSEQYRVVLLSNTNTIHAAVWGPECADMFADMEKTWFSYDMAMRKPDAEIYLHVTQAMGMHPAETLFLDDSAANLAGASSLGWQTLLIDPQAEGQFEKFCLKLLGKV